MTAILGRIAGVTLAAACAAHLASTVYMQIPGNGFGRIRERDVFSLIPSWRFFAPRPATSDYHLFSRAIDDSGGATEWVDVHPAEERRFRHLLWYPEHRVQKGVFDIMSELLSVFRSVDGVSVATQPSYQLLERYILLVVAAHPTLREYPSWQFCIATSAGYDDSILPSVLFMSRRITESQREPEPVR